jgi:hypothetical protein
MSWSEGVGALADSAYQRSLGDDMVLRWSRAEDTERLVTLAGTVFRHDEAQEPGANRIGGWARELMSGRHPLMKPNDFAVVEDTRTGALVSCACLLAQEWEYDGVTLPIGRPEIVATLPEYRRRGLVRAIFELLHARAAAGERLIQGITGIPWYYRQFGYTYAIEMHDGAQILASEIPDAPPGLTEPYSTRAATQADIPTLTRLYDQERAQAMVSTPIGASVWRWQIEGLDRRGGKYVRTWLVTNTDDLVVGYARAASELYEGQLDIRSAWLAPGHWLGGLPTLLRALRYGGAELPVELGQKPFNWLLLHLPASHPLFATLQALSIPTRPKDDPYAWYVRIADVSALMRLIAPALERRLAASPFADYTGELAIDLYRDGVRLVFETGRLAEIAEWRAPITHHEPSAGVPPEAFTQLIFGFRDLSELRHIHPDVLVSGTPAALLPVLFPKRMSWALPLG